MRHPSPTGCQVWLHCTRIVCSELVVLLFSKPTEECIYWTKASWMVLNDVLPRWEVHSGNLINWHQQDWHLQSSYRSDNELCQYQCAFKYMHINIDSVDDLVCFYYFIVLLHNCKHASWHYFTISLFIVNVCMHRCVHIDFKWFQHVYWCKLSAFTAANQISLYDHHLYTTVCIMTSDCVNIICQRATFYLDIALLLVHWASQEHPPSCLLILLV